MLLVEDYVTEIKLDTRFAHTQEYFRSLSTYACFAVEADAKIAQRDTMD